MLRENLKRLVGIQETSEGRTCDESELEIGSAASSLHKKIGKKVIMHQVGGTNRAQIRISLTARKYVFYKYLQTCFSQIPILLIARKNVFGTLMLWRFVKLSLFII